MRAAPSRSEVQRARSVLSEFVGGDLSAFAADIHRFAVPGLAAEAEFIFVLTTHLRALRPDLAATDLPDLLARCVMTLARARAASGTH